MKIGKIEYVRDEAGQWCDPELGDGVVPLRVQATLSEALDEIQRLLEKHKRLRRLINNAMPQKCDECGGYGLALAEGAEMCKCQPAECEKEAAAMDALIVASMRGVNPKSIGG